MLSIDERKRHEKKQVIHKCIMENYGVSLDQFWDRISEEDLINLRCHLLRLAELVLTAIEEHEKDCTP